MTYTAPNVFTTRPTLQGTFGMTASTHWLASACAQAVLERGGNAFDAAVAGAFVLHIVEPHLNGPGGDMTGVFVTTSEPDAPRVLMGQGPAPQAATIDHYRAEGLDLVPGSGQLAAAIPGAVDAWLLLLRDYGTWELPDVLAFALGYARDGHPILGRVVATIGSVAALFADHWPTSSAQWMPHGHLPEAGDIVTNEAWAKSLDRLLAASADSAAATREGRIDAARREWREGFVARAIVNFGRTAHRHSSGTDHAGVMTLADLAGFEASIEDATTVVFRGHTIAKTGAWGQGPALLQTLMILEGFSDEQLDPSTALGVHTILEAQKLAIADREAYYGDAVVPLDCLLSADYAATRRALITDVASYEFRPGIVPGHAPYYPVLRTEYTTETLSEQGAGASAAVGEPTVAQPAPDEAEPETLSTGELRGDTCHIDVVDRWGNMVSATPSGGWLQSSPTIPELGFCLGSRLQMTWLEPGAPSALTGGKRPRTTLTPTLVLRDGQAVTALGSPGGDQQDQWQLLYLLRTIVGGYTPQQAIDAPAFHSTSFPGSFWPRTWEPGGAVVEDRLGEAVIEQLERRGHHVTRAGDWALGRISAVTRNPLSGLLQAAANPRGAQGYAAGR
ncbi:MAG: gamma-glutamyltransferase [Cryobacterium sp.]|uniref:gamma-glutamyltransferase family protein n=1 Tax=unclassified Cryobacterium TaxID=2649013 RepID=UPI0018CA7614|nr:MULTISPECIES: gamma-glutamyltransferase [unclassified Cryobacterium]MCY7405338.1 gamma-glutamyltransferase [Cryobacterium sp.]MEC5153167.1 gamma-glutamyltranspeptidase/glutathione hydrolase [Cryobacterium sp. CAN_C3]